MRAEDLTNTGILREQDSTTYMYRTHTLNGYVLKSITINLVPFVGSHVIITAKNSHYHAEDGPEMYNVTSIAPIP